MNEQLTTSEYLLWSRQTNVLITSKTYEVNASYVFVYFVKGRNGDVGDLAIP